MKFGIIHITLLLLVSVVLTAPSILHTDLETTQLKFLNDLVLKLHREDSIETMIHLMHTHGKNCIVSNIRTPGIPVLQFNEMTNIVVKQYFNSEVLALLCINEFADTMLLTTLSTNLRHISWGRIIIWINIREPRDLPQVLATIGNQATSHKFINLLAIHQDKETVKTYHMQSYPVASFKEIDNPLDPQTQIFRRFHMNFGGKSATLLSYSHDHNPSETGFKSVIKGSYSEQIIREFARVANISLQVKAVDVFQKVMPPFDFLLNDYLFKMKDVDISIKLTDTTMMIVVPCGHKVFNILDIYRSSQSKHWLICILILYLIFSVLESVVSVCAHRVSGRRYNLTFVNIFVNLRAISTILGAPYPTSLRASMSLKQTVVVMHIAGLIITTFFSSNLTSMLTKPPETCHVRNLKELRESNLTVVVDATSQFIIKRSVDSEFFKNKVLNFLVVSPKEKDQMILSMNDSYAYLVYSNTWYILDKYHKLFNRKIFCESPDLIIIKETSTRCILEKDSIYLRNLNFFVSWLHNVGISHHWKKDEILKMTSQLDSRAKEKLRQSNSEVPLTLAYLQLAWNVLLFGYGIAFSIFLFEVAMAYWQRRRQICPVIVV